MEVPGEAKPEGDSVFLRNSDGGIQLVVHGASVEGVPASAVNRSGLLQSFAEAAGSETRLDLPIADVREWMSIADGDSIVDRRLLEALNVRNCLLHVQLQHVYAHCHPHGASLAVRNASLSAIDAYNIF